MKKTIARGIVYQNLLENIGHFFLAFFCSLTNKLKISQFESAFAKYMNSQYCVAFPYARIAIYFALKLKKIPKGSEIIMPPITIKAIYDVVIDLGLKPVFVDLDKDTLCFDCNKLKSSITEKTKAILITYLFGLVPNLDELVSICRKNNLFIIEDFSQSLNGAYKEKKVGTYGDVGVFSASSTKTLDAYGGGLLVCEDVDLYNELKKSQLALNKPSRYKLLKKIVTNFVRNLATNKYFFTCVTFPLLKWMEKRNPDIASKYLGDREIMPIDTLPYSWFRGFSSFQAKVGLKALHKVEQNDSIRVANVEYIKNKTHAFSRPNGVSHASNVYWQFLNYFERGAEDRHTLRDLYIDTATSSLLNISSLKTYPYSKPLPNVEYVYNYGYFVPCYPGLSITDLDRIVSALGKIAVAKGVKK